MKLTKSGESPGPNSTQRSDSKPNTLTYDEGFDQMIEQRMAQIKVSSGKIDEFLNGLDHLQTQILQNHQTDFVNAYKDHMLKVQFELIQFQKKSQEFYFTVKKSERVQNLEKTIEWLRTESMILSKKNEALTLANKSLKEKHTLADQESKFWKEQAFMGKNQIAILKKAIQNLKSPALLQKYEELGRQKAENQFKQVITDLRQDQVNYVEEKQDDQDAGQVKLDQIVKTLKEGLNQSGSVGKNQFTRSLELNKIATKPSSAHPGRRKNKSDATRTLSKNLDRIQTTRSYPFVIQETDAETKDFTQISPSASSQPYIADQYIKQLVSQTEKKILELVNQKPPQLFDLIVKEFEHQQLNLSKFSKLKASSDHFNCRGRSNRSNSPKTKSQSVYAPMSGRVLPIGMLQEIFFECIESVLQTKAREKKFEHTQFAPQSIASEFIQNAKDDEKVQAIMKFVSKPSVMQSLYELMFIDRKNHRGISPKPGQKTTNPIFLNDSAEVNIFGNSGEINISGDASTTNLSIPKFERRQTLSEDVSEVLNGGSQRMQSALNTFAVRNRRIITSSNNPQVQGYVAGVPQFFGQTQKIEANKEDTGRPPISRKAHPQSSSFRVQYGKLLLSKR